MNLSANCFTIFMTCSFPCVLFNILLLHHKSENVRQITCCDIFMEKFTNRWSVWLFIKEWVSFFLGSWDMNRSAEQTNRVNREVVLVRFVCSALRFISHEPRKKDTHSLYLQCLQQRPLLKFSEQSIKFPAEIGHLTLFPDKTIIAYSFRQNSAWINGEKVVCCECFHTLKQY